MHITKMLIFLININDINTKKNFKFYKKIIIFSNKI